MKKLISVLLSTVILMTSLCIAIPASAQVRGLDVNSVTKQEIEDYLMATQTYYNGTWSTDVYNTQPSATYPYTYGDVKANAQSDALKLLNSIRYIAGIPSNVALDNNYTYYSQCAAVLTAANGTISHTPYSAPGMDSVFYNAGYKGCYEGNLAIGFDTLGEAMVHGWMADDSASNLALVGHRRWILNPTMRATGFGFAGTPGTANSSHIMYAFDRNNADGNDIQSVAWPAQVMPVSYFKDSYPWTLSLGDSYGMSNPNAVYVTLTRVSDSATWTFSNTNSAYGYFNINQDSCGLSKCIIFRPNGIHYNAGDKFNVTVGGFDGGLSFNYTVEFFAPSSHATHNVSRTITPATRYADGSIVKYCNTCGVALDTVAIPQVTVEQEHFNIYGNLCFDSTRNEFFYRYQQNGQMYRTYRGAPILDMIIQDRTGKSLYAGQDYTVSVAPSLVRDGSYIVTVNYIGMYAGTSGYTLVIPAMGSVNSTVTQTIVQGQPSVVTQYVVVPTPSAVGVSATGAVTTAQIKKLTAGKKQVKVQYLKLTGVTGYEIQYSTDKKFKNKKATKVATVKGEKVTTVTIKKLTSKKKYYVRVRAYTQNGKKKTYGAWSAAKNTTIK